LQNITILDPTCGSGAFLFAALNILEPLYEICILRMQEFNARNTTLFKEQLEEITKKYRSNIQYFIYKSIILRNLYGVDIMHEATEIARLRLFLKMVAVVDVDRRVDNLGLDPLPDIDFNIRCGNTLIGYATEEELNKGLDYGDMFAKQEFKQKIEDEMQIVSTTYIRFREIQISQHEDIEVFKKAKDELNNRLKMLNGTLNQQLYKSTATYSGSHGGLTFDKWLQSYQPFHWVAEFYQIINGNGGFNVIIGNPPYVENGKKIKYQIDTTLYSTLKCGNLHAFIAERSFSICCNNGFIGLIVPLPSINTSRMQSLQSIIKPIIKTHDLWMSAYDERPSGLFSGVDQRLTIEIISLKGAKRIFSTSINRWKAKHRDYLFPLLNYTEQSHSIKNATNSILKIRSSLEVSIIKKFYQNKEINYSKTGDIKAEKIFYRTAGGRYWKVFLNIPFGTESLSEKSASFSDLSQLQAIALFSSNTFWWYYSSHFDMFNLKDYMIFSFRFSNAKESTLSKIEYLGKIYLTSLENNSFLQDITSKTRGDVVQKQYIVRKSKLIIDEIDKVLAHHYNFTEEELDFIINYDIKYRMGDELTEGE
jgi:hypothetical protein